MLGMSLLQNRSQLSGAEWTQPGLSKWQRDQLGSAAECCVGVGLCLSQCAQPLGISWLKPSLRGALLV